MSSIRKTMRRKARRVFRLRRTSKEGGLKMNKLRRTLRKMFAGGVKMFFFSHGKVVSDAHNQQANNTSLRTSCGRLSRLVAMGEKKNKTRKKVEMNTKENTLHQDKSCEAQAEKRIISVLAHEKTFVSNRVKRGRVICVGLARDIFSFGRSVSDAHNQQASNTSFDLVMTGEKKNKIRRKIEMNKLRKTLRRGARSIFIWEECFRYK